MWVACLKFVTAIRMLKMFLLPVQTVRKVTSIYDHSQVKSIYLLYIYVTACLVANFKQPLWNN
jgi:hypothetical protein